MEQQSEVETTPPSEVAAALSAIICKASSASLAVTAIRCRSCRSNWSEPETVSSEEVSFRLSLTEAFALRGLGGKGSVKARKERVGKGALLLGQV